MKSRVKRTGRHESIRRGRYAIQAFDTKLFEELRWLNFMLLELTVVDDDVERELLEDLIAKSRENIKESEKPRTIISGKGIIVEKGMDLPEFLAEMLKRLGFKF